MSASSRPLDGLRVLEVAAGTSELGLGLAGGVPGMVLADLGAEVTRVVGRATQEIDRQVEWGKAWHRNKRLAVTDDPREIRELLGRMDAALIYGTEGLVEGRGLGYTDVAPSNPQLVYARCRPSRTSTGTSADYGLLVEARAGFYTQLAGHRSGPTFVDVRAAGSGAAFLLTTSVLALLRRRALTGEGGWAETSLYDGMLATLGCMIGRSERAGPGIETYWEKGSWFPNFLYRCADDQLIQVWFGGKGMYPKLIEVLGDEPSEQGYYTDQATGALNDRAVRWTEAFATQPRQVWIERFRAVGVACEPVLGPGEVLSDPHATEVGLTVWSPEDPHHQVFVATPIAVESLGSPPQTLATEPTLPLPTPPAGVGGLLQGVKVLDFSMFVAGPLAGEILADLGAQVIKVEPPQGEAMRAAAYAMAACQRGKRSLAMDITAPEARPVVESLLRWADVVVHNFRVGVSERLGIDEATVADCNPQAVYCHASAFGTFGPRATLPGNDALMQALTGFERAIGGEGNPPVAATWIPIDMTGGWMAAAGILAGLYAKATSGRGQRVATSLLGAGMLLHSGVFQRDGQVVRGPELDKGQTGYGPGYRIYRGSDGRWFALVVPDRVAWERLGSLPEMVGLAPTYTPLRCGPDAAGAAESEEILAAAFARSPADSWVGRLGALGMAVEPVAEMNRDQFRQGILDDPLNRQLGRVVAYQTADWGHFEQIGPLLRCGPEPAGRPALILPGIGEHTVEVLGALGLTPEAIEALVDAKVVYQATPAR